MGKKWLVLACFLFVSFLPNLTLSSQNAALANKTIDFASVLDYNAGEMSLEMVISRRISIHYGDYYSDAAVPWELVSKVLWAAYGYSWRGRTVPSLSSYPVIIYVCNETAAYKFVPQYQMLTLWKRGDYRDLSGGLTAPIQLYIAFDTNLCQDVHWGNAESGCPIQNIYLMANTLNLGTVCQGGTWLDRTLIHQGLGLPENEEVLYKMPLGYPLPPYTDYQNLVAASRPSSSELPEIQDSSSNSDINGDGVVDIYDVVILAKAFGSKPGDPKWNPDADLNSDDIVDISDVVTLAKKFGRTHPGVSLEDALNLVFSSHEWSGDPLTKQELSQVLWASYGYSYYEDTVPNPPIRHRTVPSAHSYYPMRIFAATPSGVYQYLPAQHTLTTIVAKDRRSSIAQASGNAWASSAPLIIALAWNDTQILTVDTTYIEVGLIAQNVYLESAAWRLITDWGKADADEAAMRAALGLTGETNLHPVSIITVGHP